MRWRVLLLCLMIQNCGGVPVEELRLYSDAFERARSAADVMYDEIAPILRADDDRTTEPCPVNEFGYRSCFVAARALAPSAARRDDPDDVRLRRALFASVSLYNQVLTDVATGKSAHSIDTRIDEIKTIVTSATTLIPGTNVAAVAAPALMDALNTCIKKLEAARNRADARASIVEARGDIVAIIDFLIEDSERIYKIFETAKTQELGNLLIEIKRLKKFRSESINIPELQNRYNNIVANIVAFEKALGAYVRILDMSKNNIEALIVALYRQPDISMAQATSLLDEAIAVRVAADIFFEKARDLKTVDAH